MTVKESESLGKIDHLFECSLRSLGLEKWHIGELLDEIDWIFAHGYRCSR